MVFLCTRGNAVRSDEAQYSQRSIPAKCLPKICAQSVQLDLNHVIAEEYETRKCLWTAAASYDAELDRGDGFRVAIFGPPKIYLPGPIINGGTVLHMCGRRHMAMHASGLTADCTRPSRAMCSLDAGLGVRLAPCEVECPLCCNYKNTGTCGL